MQEKYKPTGTLTISPAKRRKILKVVARLPPSGLGSAALPVALPVALPGRWAVGGGLWERGMVSVSQSVRPSVEKSRLRAACTQPSACSDCGDCGNCGNCSAKPRPADTSRFRPPPLPRPAPRAHARPPPPARPRQPAPARRPARGARVTPDPRRSSPTPRGGAVTAAGRVPCVHMRNSVAAPLKRAKWSSTRGRKSGFSRAGQNKEWAGGGPAGHRGGRPASLHFSGCS